MTDSDPSDLDNDTTGNALIHYGEIIAKRLQEAAPNEPKEWLLAEAKNILAMALKRDIQTSFFSLVCELEYVNNQTQPPQA